MVFEPASITICPGTASEMTVTWTQSAHASRPPSGSLGPSTRSSSAQFLPQIRRPALLINALNDPFMPASALPRAAVTKSQWLEAAFVKQGGHAGFLEGFGGRRSWAEARALAFLRRHLLG